MRISHNKFRVFNFHFKSGEAIEGEATAFVGKQHEPIRIPPELLELGTERVHAWFDWLDGKDD